LFLVAGDVIGLAWRKIAGYIVTGTKEHGLHFYAVNQTVREAGRIPFSMFAKRISGSEIGVILSLVGYVLLVTRHRAFLLALPLIGIIPEDEHIITSTNEGEPVYYAEKSPASQAYKNIAKRILGEDVPFMDITEKKGLLKRIFG